MPVFLQQLKVLLSPHLFPDLLVRVSSLAARPHRDCGRGDSVTVSPSVPGKHPARWGNDPGLILSAL